MGSFNEAAWRWDSVGPHFGVFNYTRTLLHFRSTRMVALGGRADAQLAAPYAPSLYFSFNDTVFALLLQESSERMVLVINTAATPTRASLAATGGSDE